MKSEVYNELNDICLNIKDEGFICEVSNISHGHIKLHKGTERFYYSSVKDTVHHIKSYLYNNGYAVTVKKFEPSEKNWNKVKQKLCINSKLEVINIELLNIEIDKFFDSFLKK